MGLFVAWGGGSSVLAAASDSTQRGLPWEEAKIACLLSRSSGSLTAVTSSAAGLCRSQDSDSATSTRGGADTMRRFRDDLCTHPERACDRLVSRMEALPASQDIGGVDLRGVPVDSACNPHPLWVQAQIATPQAESTVAGTLRARTGAPTTVAAIYQGPQWEQAKRLVESVRTTLVSQLAEAPVRAPAAVIERIRTARVLDPNDPSIPLEKKKELLKTCEVSPTEESKPALGIFNAFASPEGWVVICPKMLLSAASPATLGMILLHEMGHLIGPCQVGFSLTESRSGPQCQISTNLGVASGQLLSWRSHLLAMESCFHDGGLNRGGVPSWAIRDLEQIAASGSATAPTPAASTCEATFDDFNPSADPQKGLLSACDPSQLYLALSVSVSLKGLSSESRLERLKSAFRMMQLGRQLMKPNHNQFDESFSDYLASRYLPQVLSNAGVPAASGEWQGVDEAMGFSTLCDVDRPRALRNEVHPEGDQRMAIFTSQREIRQRMGCAARPGFFEETARTIGSCSVLR